MMCFTCDINPNDYIGRDGYDDWGLADFMKGKYGVEYNMCRDGKDQSAWYSTEQANDGIIQTNYNRFVKYTIDFSDSNWEEKLLQSAIEAFNTLQGGR